MVKKKQMCTDAEQPLYTTHRRQSCTSEDSLADQKEEHGKEPNSRSYIEAKNKYMCDGGGGGEEKTDVCVKSTQREKNHKLKEYQENCCIIDDDEYTYDGYFVRLLVYINRIWIKKFSCKEIKNEYMKMRKYIEKHNLKLWQSYFISALHSIQIS